VEAVAAGKSWESLRAAKIFDAPSITIIDGNRVMSWMF
jgi:hypothetical protein